MNCQIFHQVVVFYSNVSGVTYYHVDHTRKDGTLANRLDNTHSIGQKSAYESWMSKKLKDYIIMRLIEGLI